MRVVLGEERLRVVVPVKQDSDPALIFEVAAAKYTATDRQFSDIADVPPLSVVRRGRLIEGAVVRKDEDFHCHVRDCDDDAPYLSSLRAF